MFKVVWAEIKNLFRVVDSDTLAVIENLKAAGHRLTQEVEALEKRIAELEAHLFPANPSATPVTATASIPEPVEITSPSVESTPATPVQPEPVSSSAPETTPVEPVQTPVGQPVVDSSQVPQ